MRSFEGMTKNTSSTSSLRSSYLFSKVFKKPAEVRVVVVWDTTKHVPPGWIGGRRFVGAQAFKMARRIANDWRI
jgi:hypothetical protein